jgi:hypothetical protein
MVDGYEVYLKYVAIKTHFTVASFSYFKYKGKIKFGSREKFESRNDKSFYYVLGKKYHDNLIPFLVANFCHDDLWIGDLLTEPAETCYRNYQKKQESLSYVYQSDLKKMLASVANPQEILEIKNGQNSHLLTHLYKRQINLETVIILNELMEFFEYYSKNLSDDLIWPKYRMKCEKLKPFLKLDMERLRNITLKETT